MAMIKLVFGLLTYKIKYRKLFDKNLSTYPEGYKAMHDSLGFAGDLQETFWSTFLLFTTYF